MPSLTNISLKRQVKTSENGSIIFGNSGSAGGFVATFKKGSDNNGGALTLEGNFSAGSGSGNLHTIRGTTTFGSGTTISIDDTGNISVGGTITVTDTATFNGTVDINGTITGDTNGDVKINNSATLVLSVRTAPTTTQTGQIFVDSGDNYRLKYFDGSVFQTVQTGGTLTFNAIRQKEVVNSGNAGRTSISLTATPIGADATERNAMVKVYLNGIYIDENRSTSSDAVSGTNPYTFTISIPAGEKITPYSLTFEIAHSAGTVRGKDIDNGDGTGTIQENGSTGGITISSGSVNYSTGVVNVTLSSTISGFSNANSVFSVADYIYTDLPAQVDVFGTIPGDKIIVWYLVP